MKKAVVFGAGNIGRGFLGQLFFESGYRTVFVDVIEKVVSLLNEKRSYPLWIVSDESTQKLQISNVGAVSAEDGETVAQQLAEADISATAVGVNNLEKIAPLLSRGIAARIEARNFKPLNIVICENLLSAGEVLRTDIEETLPPQYLSHLSENVGLVETVVSRMVPPVPEDLKKKEPLLVLVEPYKILPVAKNGFKGEIPSVTGFLPVENIHAYEELKLYGHNLIHAVCAYLGFLKGCRYIWEAVKNEEVRKVVAGVLKEVEAALMKKHNFSRRELKDYSGDLLRRFANKALGDTVYRVGREPLRKLSPSDRLVGAARLCLNFGVNPEHIIFTLAAALCYNYQDDSEAKELQRLISEKGAGYVLQAICKINSSEPIYNTILENYNKLKTKM